MSILKGKDIVKIYQGEGKNNSVNALNGVDITLESGEFVAIMGPSGSGKTTLLNVLSGIDKLTSGIVEISGQDISKMNKNELALFRRQKLGFVFQEFNLLDSLSLKENVMLPMILDGKDTEEIEKRTQDIMTLLDIDSIGNKYSYTVSGGQQQRAAICRAVINNPDIVFADEPTGNLDSKSSKAVMKCFEKLNEANRSTILMVTHDAFAASYCKKVIFLKDGNIINEILNTGSNERLFYTILDTLAEIGGDKNDFS